MITATYNNTTKIYISNDSAFPTIKKKREIILPEIELAR